MIADGIALVPGIDVTLHRRPSARVDVANHPAVLDGLAAGHVWSDPVEFGVRVLPDYVLADRAIPQFPAIWIKTIPNTRPIDNRIQELLASIEIPTMPHQWTAYVRGTVADCPPPWMRAHREALGLPIDDTPDRDRGGRSQARVMAALSLLALGAILAWIILGAIR